MVPRITFVIGPELDKWTRYDRICPVVCCPDKVSEL